MLPTLFKEWTGILLAPISFKSLCASNLRSLETLNLRGMKTKERDRLQVGLAVCINLYMLKTRRELKSFLKIVQIYIVLRLRLMLPPETTLSDLLKYTCLVKIILNIVNWHPYRCYKTNYILRNTVSTTSFRKNNTFLEIPLFIKLDFNSKWSMKSLL